MVEELEVGTGQAETAIVNEAEEASTVAKETIEIQAGKAEEMEDSVVNSENRIGKSAEKAKTGFSCLMCDFRSNWENGLKIHMTRKHCDIEQIDGNIYVASDEVDDDKKYSETSLLEDRKTGNNFPIIY